ncbi:MAG: Nif3-like dinuclear metal center hexameric protein [Herbaspirillum sp.]
MTLRTADRDELGNYLAQVLNITQYRDYCPNGLQVEGRAEIGLVVSGVTASQALIDAALDLRADAILVHHGYFWRGEEARVTGIRRKRLKALLSNDLNLFAYHLPLDAHPEWGNNAQLARRLNLVGKDRFGADGLGWSGALQIDAGIAIVGDLVDLIARRLGRMPLLIGDVDQPVGKVAWCTGGAQGFLGDAIAAGASVYISGEISEPTVHLAREAGVAYIAAGHHATERYGVQALGAHIADRFGIRHQFVDIDNPV